MSSGSESDDDYVPGVPEQLSEEESADDETEHQYEKEQEQKATKRKLKSEKVTKKKRKLRKDVDEEVKECEDNKESAAAPIKPEEEKKYEEDLWAKFLEGTDTKPKNKANDLSTPKPAQQTEIITSKTPANVDDEKSREKRIFEFAGEKIVVENNEIAETLPANSDEHSSEGGKTQEVPVRSRKAGLSGLVGQLNKKNTLSTLEKSKLDWNMYKKQEGVEDEIRSINKGKKGYLDRQDFLERADQRQYEIERELRMSKRSNR